MRMYTEFRLSGSVWDTVADSCVHDTEPASCTQHKLTITFSRSRSTLVYAGVLPS
jgi:hypothetical protein